MILRKHYERGYFDHGWLKSHHSFSFAGYFDPKWMGWQSLRVINDDWVEAGQGFGTHPHRDMEIITYVLSGKLEHKDSMGNGRVVNAGEVQAMSAGTGITHSEFNPSSTEPLHLLQIWIVPNKHGVKPSYSEWYPPKEPVSGWQLLASPEGKDGGVPIHQDARMYLGKLEKGQSLASPSLPGRYGYLHIATGSGMVEGSELEMGDALLMEKDEKLTFTASESTELLFFDLA